jgi:hypothetical protein
MECNGYFDNTCAVGCNRLSGTMDNAEISDSGALLQRILLHKNGTA